jgi:hypothetical protein
MPQICRVIQMYGQYLVNWSDIVWSALMRTLGCGSLRPVASAASMVGLEKRAKLIDVCPIGFEVFDDQWAKFSSGSAASYACSVVQK